VPGNPGSSNTDPSCGADGPGRCSSPTQVCSPRTPEQIGRFFDGLDLVAPGVVSCSRWRPDPSTLGGQPAEVDEFSGVARKPAAPQTPPSA
jgi:hypothetical protein